MIALVQDHLPELADLCRRYRVKRLDLIGSAVRDDFDSEKSDIDFVVEFELLTVENAFDRYFGLLEDLQRMFRRKVDLVSDTAIRNPYFRQVVDRTRVPLYAA